MNLTSRRTPTRRLLTAVLAVAAMTTAACGSTGGGTGDGGGSSYPQRDVQVIVPYPAGSGIDTTTRAVVDIINKDGDFGQRLQVVNREGGAGVVGTTAVLNAKPDGYTVGVVPDGPLTLVPQTQEVSYDPTKLTVIEELIAGPIMFVVPDSSPYATLDDLLADAQKRPSTITIGEGPLNYRIPVDVVEDQKAVKFKRVKFDGDQATTTALLGDNVDVGVMQLASALPQLSSGKLRAIAIASPEPVDLAPDIATFMSQGVDLQWLAYNHVIAPAGLDDDVKEKLADAWHSAVTSDEFAAAAKKLGLIPSGVGSEQAAKDLQTKTADAKTFLELGR